ncbi:sulfatase-like hydrolase/transferase [Tundrisphaera lichenicola]|uniref:sulfatase n=1 Tax=Tundrisphaera lichenicola TaxID=2029860 RepID=UPI003EBB1EB0
MASRPDHQRAESDRVGTRPSPSTVDRVPAPTSRGVYHPSTAFRRLLSRTTRSRNRAATSEPTPEGPLGPDLPSFLGASMAVGVSAGFLELAVFAIQVYGLGRVGLKTLAISRHVAWMIPVAGTLLVIGLAIGFAAPALAWSAWRARRPRTKLEARSAADWAGMVLGTLLVLVPLLAIRGLHPAAALILALSVGYRLRSRLVRPSLSWRRAARWGGGAALGVLVIFSGWQWSRVAHAVERAWARPSVAGPNLLWIVLDTVRADRMSLYGYDRATTPRLDEWAREGITFDAAYSAAPWTLPSHLTMFTGLWPFEHGARVDRPFRGPAPTIAEHLGQKGYATAGIVANSRMCNDVFGVGRGFDTYVDVPSKTEVDLTATLLNSALGNHLLKLARRLGLPVQDELAIPEHPHAPEIAEQGLAWLDHVRRRNVDEWTTPDRPSFLFLNFMDVHGPYIPAPHVTRTFWTGPIPDRDDVVPRAGWVALQARDSAPPDQRLARQQDLDGVTRRLGDLYDDCLLGLDGDLGRFLDQLRDQGQLENTWVVITADHGEHLGEHGRFGHVSTLYNELIRVPLVLIPPIGRDPEGDDPHATLRGRRVDVPVSHRDLPTTMTELLDPGSPSPFPGRSLARHWGKDAHQPAGPILSQLEEQSMMGDDVHPDHVVTLDSIIKDDAILIEFSDGAPELYQRREDPRQLLNRANQPEGMARRSELKREMDAIIRSSRYR